MDEKRREAGHKLLEAAHGFWSACHEEGQYGAIQWLTGATGELVIFTRGEYRSQLLANIMEMPNAQPEHFFGEEMPCAEDD